MSILSLFRRDKLQRFAKTVRDEGLKRALIKTRRYLRAHFSGGGLSFLLGSASGPLKENHEYLIPMWREAARQKAFHLQHAPAFLTGKRNIVMIGDLNLPQCRKYRIEQLAEIWNDDNITYEYAHYEDVLRSAHMMQSATHVMFYRMRNTPITSMLSYEARRLKLPMLYDLDDPLFSVSAYETYGNMTALPDWMLPHFVSEAPKYLDVMNSSDIICVSTPGLQAHARQYTARPVHVRRNFADIESLQRGAEIRAAAPMSRSDGFRLLFASGSQGHEADFAQIAQDVFAFLDRDPSRKLVIVGHFELNHIPEKYHPQIEAHPFTDYTGYLSVVASSDACVLPLIDDAFNRCKSAVRVIDAASVSVPSLVGAVGDLSALIVPGETGHVMSAGQSWLPALENLAQDRAGSRDMGLRARADLQTRWCASREGHIIDPGLVDWVMG